MSFFWIRKSPFDAAFPYLKILPISGFKIFLSKSAKYGFFDQLSLNEIDHDHDTNNNDNEDQNLVAVDTKFIDEKKKNVLNWCKLSKWVSSELEYDETRQLIDSTRPLYRCSYCLKYGNTMEITVQSPSVFVGS